MSQMLLTGAGGGGAAALGLKTNLVAWWELNEASGSRADSHTNALTLTDNNTVTSAAGIGGSGTAAEFTAVNSESLSHVDDDLLEIADNDWTACGWIYLADKTAPRPLIGKWNQGGTRQFFIEYDSGSDRFLMYVRKGDNSGDASVTATTFGSPSATTWYFICAQHDSVNDLIKISVNDGAFNTSALTVGIFTGATDFSLGLRTEGGAKYHNGRIAKVGLWRSTAGGGGVLTAAQITALYNAGAGLSYAQLT